ATSKERVCEEAVNLRQRRPVNDADRLAQSRPRSGDDVGLAVAVHVADGNTKTIYEGRIISQERGAGRTVAAEHLDARRPPSPGAGDNIGPAVSIDIARGHEDASGKGGIVRQETRNRQAIRISAAEYL